ncbi:MAG: DUF2975 domain-containing protein [Coriobacteriaceae bacterium]|nr:DUF2975 domain-containing protein [Coriobacteriaceae bacterium]
MGDSRIETNDNLLNRLNKKLHAMNPFFFGVVAVSFAVWLVFFVLSTIDLFVCELFDDSLAKAVFNFGTIVLLGAVMVVLVRLASAFLKDVTIRRTPFSKAQARRVRRISYLLFAYGVLDTLFSMVFTSRLFFDGFNGQGSMAPPITVGIYLAAIALYALSFVFDYGVELQRQSDSIL